MPAGRRAVGKTEERQWSAWPLSYESCRVADRAIQRLIRCFAGVFMAKCGSDRKDRNRRLRCPHPRAPPAGRPHHHGRTGAAGPPQPACRDRAGAQARGRRHHPRLRRQGGPCRPGLRHPRHHPRGARGVRARRAAHRADARGGQRLQRDRRRQLDPGDRGHRCQPPRRGRDRVLPAGRNLHLHRAQCPAENAPVLPARRDSIRPPIRKVTGR